MGFRGTKKQLKTELRRQQRVTKRNPGRFGFVAGRGRGGPSGPSGAAIGQPFARSDPNFPNIGVATGSTPRSAPIVRKSQDDMFSPRSISQFKILSGDDLSEERKKRKKKFKKKLKGSKKKKTKQKEDPLAFRIARVPFG